jgi:hypothetical protein
MKKTSYTATAATITTILSSPSLDLVLPSGVQIQAPLHSCANSVDLSLGGLPILTSQSIRARQATKGSLELDAIVERLVDLA